ncbi:MAG: RNA methyltransferase [Flavobacterium sp.]|nr:RNA methyltransferase [Flavobacterium sp.]
MVSKSQIKLIRSLHQKKHRQIENMFIAEGVKVISELLDSKIRLVHLYQTDDIFPGVNQSQKTTISASDLARISALTTPNNSLAIFEIPTSTFALGDGLIVALDDIRDPGNLGTIIRLCDWFGVKQIICSNETADLYNPKVVQATMGSMARVDLSYVDLNDLLSKSNLPIFGTFMDGDNIYQQDLPSSGIIVFGNEANGISDIISQNINRRIAIPRFGELQATESLNVATATAIVLSEFRRKS